MASEARLTIVDLVKSLNTLHIDTILHLVKDVVKKPHQIKGEQVHKHTYMREKTCTVQVYKSNSSFIFIFFYLNQKSSLVDVPMLQFSYAYTQRYVGKYNLSSHISFCKTILHMLMFIIMSVFCVKYFSSGTAGKHCLSTRSVAGVCSTQPCPTWALLTAGVSFCIISTYSILLLVLLYYKMLLGSAYTNGIRA